MIKIIKRFVKKSPFLTKVGLYLLDKQNQYEKEKRKRRFEEKHCSWGKENPDKVFYIIRRSDYYVGWGSLLSVIIGRIAEAEDKGWIPVVDLKNEKNAYIEDGEIGEKDAWEYYFEPLAGYGLEDIQKSKNIILSDGGGENVELLKPIDFDRNYNTELFIKWKRLTKQYIHLRKSVLDKINREMENLFHNEDKILGILARGTDYVARKPKEHPVQPEVEVLFEKAEWVMQTYHCNKIFLASEDKAIYKNFIKRFGKENVLINQKEWINYAGDKLLSEFSNERKDDKYLKGLEYLTTLYILSKCPCIIGGRTSATPLIACMAENTEYVYFWDLGVY